MSEPTSIDLDQIFKAYDVRGLVPDQLNENLARAIGAAFARVVVKREAPEGSTSRPRAVVGHDMRPTGPDLVDAFTEGLTRAGIDVTVVGLCSTDELYFASGSLGLPGAVFTASHNPAKYNGIKFCRAGARPVGAESGLAEIQELAERYLREGLPEGEHVGSVSQANILPEYAKYLRSLVDLTNIRQLRVVIDAGNGMAGLTVPAVLGRGIGLPQLPLGIVPLYFELDGTFPHHEANPLEPTNTRDLQAEVVRHRADLGLAFDGDADRCFVVDERGRRVSPSAITGLVGLREAAREVKAGGRPIVLHNLITSRAVSETLHAAGVQTVLTRVGHSFIKAQMAELGAVFGGEHSGHFYFRDFFGADTGMLAALHVLAALGEQDLPLSELVAFLDRYPASGEINTHVQDTTTAAARVRKTFVDDAVQGPVEVDGLDGLTVSHWDCAPRWWFNLRSSNTEPMLRLNVEAQDRIVMERIRDEVLRLLQDEEI